MKTGNVLWKMLASQNGGSVTPLKDHPLMIRDDGEIFKIKPDPEKVDVLSNFKVLDGKIRAFPAIGNGLVGLRNTRTLACLRQASGC